MTKILVTGATGTVASEVLSALENKAGVEVRAGVRSAEKGGALRRANITPVDFDYERPETVRAALDGVDRVFLLTPFVQGAVGYGKALTDAAKAAGATHIVKLSAFGCDFEPGIQLGRWHREVEKYIEGSGLAYTFLRPNNFMENFLNYYPPGPDGNIYLPWGDGACSFVAGADIGAVAAEALTKDGHAGKAYTLTGPSALTIGDAARTISEVSGRAVRYVDVPEDAARQAMLGMGMPAWMVDGMMELHAIDKAGYAAVVTDAVKTVTGRDATPFPAFAQKHAARWKV
ncbi:MAG: SDR family oxidoreductase [Byssovorax sp.]